MSLSVTTETTSERITGQVKWFNTKSGYGFITVCDGEFKGKDIFVHYSSLDVTNSQYRYLVQGEYVDFHLIKSENDKYEYHATNVSGVKGGVIMCETRRIAAETQPTRQEHQQYRGRQHHNSDASDLETSVERVVKKRVDGDDFQTVGKKPRRTVPTRNLV